jgi:hypothetical protein
MEWKCRMRGRGNHAPRSCANSESDSGEFAQRICAVSVSESGEIAHPKLGRSGARAEEKSPIEVRPEEKPAEDLAQINEAVAEGSPT